MKDRPYDDNATSPQNPEERGDSRNNAHGADTRRPDRAQATPAPDQPKPQGRGPDYVAYPVKERGQEQDPVWRAVGAAWQHKDGRGLDVVLDAFPTDGRLTLREQRKEAFKTQRRARQEQGRDQERSYDGSQAPNHKRGPSQDR